MKEIKARLQQLGDADTAKVLQRFFKTGVGEYGEGDVFVGIKVPPLRKLAAEFQAAPMKVLRGLLRSKIHEERVLALMILVRQFGRADSKLREEIYEFYL